MDEITIIRMSNCRIGKCIEHPVVTRPDFDDTERIVLKLILDCDIELFADADFYERGLGYG